MLDPEKVRAFVHTLRTLPTGSVVQETMTKLATLPDIAPQDMVSHCSDTFNWYHELLHESKISLAPVNTESMRLGNDSQQAKARLLLAQVEQELAEFED